LPCERRGNPDAGTGAAWLSQSATLRGAWHF